MPIRDDEGGAVVGVAGVTCLFFSMSKSMYTYKRVVLSSHADVARDANDVDTCLTKPSTAMRARARGVPIPRATARF